MKVKDLKKIADEQFAYFGETGLYPERCISFFDERSGQTIINPWMDPSGRFELSLEEAIDTYGLFQVVNFMTEIATKKML